MARAWLHSKADYEKKQTIAEKNSLMPTIQTEAVDIDQFSSDCIEQAASDCTKFLHAMYRNILFDIVTIGNCLLINFPKQTQVILRIQALLGSICKDILHKVGSLPHCKMHDGLPIIIGIAVKYTSTNDLLYGPLTKAFRTYGVRVMYLLNAIFRIVPQLFYQCLILMTINPVTRLFAPCIYMLMTA
ncbi:LOW QUALITY PROTEIN: hypothetical protein MXB_2930 [Myxobolus squamalis]|nr:LOW QUALITY PROTEIN: hypothetical protein MXB_2930 [Myxobolus squamalis]